MFACSLEKSCTVPRLLVYFVSANPRDPFQLTINKNMCRFLDHEAPRSSFTIQLGIVPS